MRGTFWYPTLEFLFFQIIIIIWHPGHRVSRMGVTAIPPSPTFVGGSVTGCLASANTSSTIITTTTTAVDREVLATRELEALEPLELLESLEPLELLESLEPLELLELLESLEQLDWD